MFKYYNSYEQEKINFMLNRIIKIKSIRKKILPLKDFDCRKSTLNKVDILTSLTEVEQEFILDKMNKISNELSQNALNKLNATTFENVMSNYNSMIKTNLYSSLNGKYHNITINNFAEERLEDLLLKSLLRAEGFSDENINVIGQATYGAERLITLYGKDYVVDNSLLDESMWCIYDTESALNIILNHYDISCTSASLEEIIIANTDSISDEDANNNISSCRSILKKEFSFLSEYIYIDSFDIEVNKDGEIELDLLSDYNMSSSTFIKFNITLSDKDVREFEDLFNPTASGLYSDPYTESVSEFIYVKEDNEVIISLSEAYQEVGVSPFFLIKLIQLIRTF